MQPIHETFRFLPQNISSIEKGSVGSVFIFPKAFKKSQQGNPKLESLLTTTLPLPNEIVF
jgi:hypothetical protein